VPHFGYTTDLVRSTGAIVSNPHLHSVKSCPEKGRPIKYGGQMHDLMIAIEHSYKLDKRTILINFAN